MFPLMWEIQLPVEVGASRLRSVAAAVRQLRRGQRPGRSRAILPAIENWSCDRHRTVADGQNRWTNRFASGCVQFTGQSGVI